MNVHYIADNACPICIVPFLALIAEEEMARAMDSPAQPVEELGVTRLVGDGRCGHVFCRKEYVFFSLCLSLCTSASLALYISESLDLVSRSRLAAGRHTGIDKLSWHTITHWLLLVQLFTPGLCLELLNTFCRISD
jgi:hypothetical protein